MLLVMWWISRVLQIIQHIQAMHIVPLFYVVENSFALLIIILQKSYLPFSIYIYILFALHNYTTLYKADSNRAVMKFWSMCLNLHNTLIC